MNYAKGFTLIELLIVIIIIGILATLTFISYSSSDKQARDAQRKNDITQYRNLLQQYAVSHNATYPTSTNPGSPETITSSNLCGEFQPVLSPCLTDPVAGSNPFNDGGPTLNYWYIGDGKNYVLYARMESGSDKFWESCSNGLSGVVSTNTSGVNIPPTDASDCGVI